MADKGAVAIAEQLRARPACDLRRVVTTSIATHPPVTNPARREAASAGRRGPKASPHPAFQSRRGPVGPNYTNLVKVNLWALEGTM